MDPALVLTVQCALALWGFILIARRFAVPMLERHPLEDALCLLCLFHSFRYVVLGAFAPGSLEPITSHGLTIGGDLTSSALALIAAAMLHVRAPGAIQMAWVFNLVGLADLTVSLPRAIDTQLMGEPLAFAWQLFVFYVPALFVTHLMMLGWLFRYVDRLQRLYAAAFHPAIPATRPSARPIGNLS